MNIRAVLFVLGNLLMILGLTLVLPLLVALYYDSGTDHETAEIVGLGSTALFAVIGGVIVRWLYRGSADGVRLREGFAIVTLSWLLMAVVGMMPLVISGVAPSVTDAFFETMSGFTTTGASIFPEVEIIPHGLMFWRCMTQWLGGMGIVVLSVALLPMLGVGGYRLLKAEAPGGITYERERPRITDSAKQLWKLYVLFSVVLAVLLWISGMSPFDAVCHCFTTMSTGGFSPHTESLAYYSSPLTQWIVIIFMLVAGVNFSLHARILRLDFRSVLINREFRGYIAIILSLIVFGVVVLGRDGLSERVVRDVTFQMVSIGTTTGFTTVDFNLWPHSLRFAMFALMFIGGCMGSTAGGMKVARLIVYAKAVVRELHRMIFPHGVRPIRVGVKVLEESVVSNLFAFAAAWAALFVFGAVVMSACGYGMVTSMTASVAALGNIGPGFVAVGPTANWSHLPAIAKWIMCFLMLCGRLEVFSVLILFSPWVWRR